jgi:hypothetical protein
MLSFRAVHTSGGELMNPRTLGIVGCVALLLGAALGAAVVFGEKAIVAAGLPYHFVNYAGLATMLSVAAAVCGVRSWATPAGKIAAVGGIALVVAVVGFVVLVFVAFSYSR